MNTISFSDYSPGEKYLCDEIANITSDINSITKPNTKFGTEVNSQSKGIDTASKVKSLLYATVLFYVCSTDSCNNINITLKCNSPLYECQRVAGSLESLPVTIHIKIKHFTGYAI